jgi:hypothetical protein
MKSHTTLSMIIVAALLQSIPGNHSIGQSKQETSLEARVEILEQKVRMLESRIGATPVNTMAEAFKAFGGIRREIERISQEARWYFQTRARDNGGTGSYRGFTMPPFRTLLDDAIHLEVTPTDSNVVIVGTATNVIGKISVVLDRAGKLGNWVHTGDFSRFGRMGSNFANEFIRHSETMKMELDTIIADSYQYRAYFAGRGRGAYRGYVIPERRASSSVGWYTAVPSDTGMSIEGRSKKYNFIRLALIDGGGNVQRMDSIRYSGEMKKSVGSQKSVVDSVRDTITADFMNLRARAYEYRNRPVSNGGGGGKFVGYLSAQTSSLDGQAHYEFRIDPDVILLEAVSTRGMGTMSARIDAGGNLTGWYYTGKLAE